MSINNVHISIFAKLIFVWLEKTYPDWLICYFGVLGKSFRDVFWRVWRWFSNIVRSISGRFFEEKSPQPLFKGPNPPIIPFQGPNKPARLISVTLTLRDLLLTVWLSEEASGLFFGDGSALLVGEASDLATQWLILPFKGVNRGDRPFWKGVRRIFPRTFDRKLNENYRQITSKPSKKPPWSFSRLPRNSK